MADLVSRTGAIAFEPRCPVHGKMSHDFSLNAWICHGWDGEDCDHRVRVEDLDWIPAKNIRIEGVRFGGH